jgi:glycosyltransferase involved in cell wall biosynthesis
MKIGFDISQTGRNKAGCGYFAHNLIQKLVDLDRQNQYLLYSAFGTRFWDAEHGTYTLRFKDKHCTHLLDELSHQESLALWGSSTFVDEKKLGTPDIVHANNFSCPTLASAHLVYTLYDLSFLEYPEFTQEENRWNCFNGVFDAATRADFVIAISEYSRQRFLQVFPHFPEERTRVVYLGSRFEGDVEQPVSGLVPNGFWLSVGTLEPRKNLRRTLRAYRKYLDSHADTKPMILAGGQGWLEDDLDQFIDTLGLTKYVRKLGYVDDASLQWLYKNCWAFVYPSIYEGFGLPVLEAMSLGAAVITAKTTSLPEVGGNAVLYVDPESEMGIVQAFTDLQNPNLRDRLRAAGREQASKFSWLQTAEQMLQVYTDVLHMPKRLSHDLTALTIQS